MKKYILNLIVVLLVVTALSVVALNANSIDKCAGITYVSDANDPNEPEPEPESIFLPAQINYLTDDPNDPNEPEPEPESCLYWCRN